MIQRLALCFALFLAPAWTAGELSNRRAPGFSLPDRNIKQHDLADYRGKVVLLEIMLTTCPHCVTSSKTLDRISRKYPGRVQALAIVNPPDTTASVSRFIQEHGISYPILFDSGQAAASYMMATPQKSGFAVPHLFVIDQNGTIRSDYSHSFLTLSIFEGQGLFEEVEKLLGGGAAKKAASKKAAK